MEIRYTHYCTIYFSYGALGVCLTELSQVYIYHDLCLLSDKTVSRWENISVLVLHKIKFYKGGNLSLNFLLCGVINNIWTSKVKTNTFDTNISHICFNFFNV